MATVIRFARHGKNKKPFFRMVVQDQRTKRDGKCIERIGTFDPRCGLQSLSVSRERLMYWLSMGAQMSVSVRNRLRSKLREWRGEEPPKRVPAEEKKM